MEFSGAAQGECIVEMDTIPSTTPDVYHFGSGSINLTGNADAEPTYEYSNRYLANQTVNTSGNLSAEYNNQTINIDVYPSNNTIAYFINDLDLGDGQIDYFILGAAFDDESMPLQSRLLYTGSQTDANGTHAISGTAVIYSAQETTFESSRQVFGAIIFNADNTTLASVIWSQEGTVLPFGPTLNAASLFQTSINVYSVAPTVKITANASGACALQQFIEPENDSENVIHQGNGSIAFNAMALSETGSRYYIDTYIFESGIYALGSLSVNWDNQSINANIYTNGSGAGGIILKEPEREVFMIGNMFMDNTTAITFDGTYQNATETQNISGIFQILSTKLAEEENSTSNYVIEAVLYDQEEAPLAFLVWSEGNSYSGELNLTAADSFSRSVDFCPSACTTVVSDNGSIVADHTAATGAKVTINGATLPNGTAFNITTVNYGSTQPIIVGDNTVNGAIYYDVRILQASGEALGSNVTAQIALTDSSFNASSAISYWNGSSWISAVNQQFTAPHTISGAIPASALTDTPVMVDYSALPPQTSPTPTSSPSTTPTSVIPEYTVVVILGLMILLTVFVLIVRLRVRHKLVSVGSSTTAL